jgi:hypothetical protein
MARKRGGLAGLWDRNKGIIKPIATLAAGALTGGAGGALVGGLMSGLDRPGKGGIGFDVAKGAMGAAQGYAMGKGGQGLKNLFTSSAAPAISGAVPGVGITPGGAGPLTQSLKGVPGVSMPGLSNVAASSATNVAQQAAAQAASQGGGRMKILKDLFSPEGIGGVAKGTLGAIQSEREMGQRERQFERTAKLNESRFAEEQRQANLNEERRRRMAQLMAMFAPSAMQGMGRPPMEQG